MIYKHTRGELKTKAASDLKDGDTVFCGKYVVHIIYKSGKKVYKTPSLLSMVEDKNTFQILDCTPGVSGGRPYYIDDFIGR